MDINEKDYFEILSSIGFPVVKEEDLEYSREDIQDLFIYPALREYFIWFPKIEESSHNISGKFSFDFPNEETFGVYDSRLNTTAAGSGHTTSPFMNELIFSTRSNFGSYGTRFDYGMDAARYSKRAERRANYDYGKSYKIYTNYEERKIEGFTNVPGELVIFWAQYSDNFSDIPFRRKTEVIKLAQSKILSGFAMLRGQLNADVGVDFDVSLFENKANDLEQEVMEKWQSKTKPVVIRG